MAAQSQRHVRDLIFDSVVDAVASGRVFECCYVKETQTHYEFVNSLPVVIDHKRILSTIKNGFSRWKAVGGKYAFDFQYPKHTIPATDILYLTQYTQYVIHGTMTLGEDVVLTIEDDAALLIV